MSQFELGGSYRPLFGAAAADAGRRRCRRTSRPRPASTISLSFDIVGDPEAISTLVLGDLGRRARCCRLRRRSGSPTTRSMSSAIASLSRTPLQFDLRPTIAPAMLLDSVSVSPTTGPATESTAGSISFSDAEAGDTHTASFTPQGGGYVGTFSLDPVSGVPGSGSVAWHFTVEQCRHPVPGAGPDAGADYSVTILDSNGGSDRAGRHRHHQRHQRCADRGERDRDHRCRRQRHGRHSRLGSGVERHRSRHHRPSSLGSVTSSSGGSAGRSLGFAFFTDDATLGGSFNYTASDGIDDLVQHRDRDRHQQRGHATTLTGTGGDDILIATNGTETMNGGGGNDVLIGTASGNVMTGGSGNDTFAFLQPPTARRDHRLQQHHRARPHRHFRERLRRRPDGGDGRDVDIRDLGRQYSSPASRRIPLRYGKPDALFQRGRHPRLGACGG